MPMGPRCWGCPLQMPSMPGAFPFGSVRIWPTSPSIVNGASVSVRGSLACSVRYACTSERSWVRRLGKQGSVATVLEGRPPPVFRVQDALEHPPHGRDSDSRLRKPPIGPEESLFL